MLFKITGCSWLLITLATNTFCILSFQLIWYFLLRTELVCQIFLINGWHLFIPPVLLNHIQIQLQVYLPYWATKTLGTSILNTSEYLGSWTSLINSPISSSWIILTLDQLATGRSDAFSFKLFLYKGLHLWVQLIGPLLWNHHSFWLSWLVKVWLHAIIANRACATNA